MGGALILIVLEHARVGPARKDEIQPPGQTHRVAHPRAHALPQERRHLVGGVSGQQDPAVAPGLRPEGVELVIGYADDLDLPLRHEGAQFRADIGGVGGFGFRHAVRHHELPLVVGAGHGHEGDGLGGVAELIMVGGKGRVLAAGQGLHVHDHPGLVEVGAFEGDLRLPAHRAAPAVTADDVSGADRGLVLAVLILDLDRGSVCVLADVRHDAPEDGLNV